MTSPKLARRHTPDERQSMPPEVIMIRRSILLLASSLLLTPLVACDDGGSGTDTDTTTDTSTTTDTGTGITDRFPDLVVEADKSAMVGRIVDVDGTPQAAFRVAACSDVDCPFAKTDENGFFIHNGLNPLPRRFEIFGQYDKYGSVVFRRDFTAGEKLDVGDIVISDVSGAKAEWPIEAGGTILLAGGRLEVTAGANEVKWPIGTVEFAIQAAPLDAIALPPFYNQPWLGKTDEAITFQIIPFDVRGTVPLQARVLTGVNKPAGTKYNVFHCDPLDGLLEPAGTATIDADGILVTDPDATLMDLTFVAFVPQ